MTLFSGKTTINPLKGEFRIIEIHNFSQLRWKVGDLFQM